MSLQTRMDLLGPKTRTKKGIVVGCAYRHTISVPRLVLTPICVTFGAEISLFVSHLCDFACLLFVVLFCCICYVYRAPLVRACCLLHGSTPKLGWATAPKPPPGGVLLRRPGIRGSHSRFFRSDRGVVPSLTHVYVHAP